MTGWNAITLYVWLGFWPVWLVWEMAILVLRGEQVSAMTISMVAQRVAWRLPSVVYAWYGLAAHWWWNGKSWASWPGALAFWLIMAGLLAWDIVCWGATSKPLLDWPQMMLNLRFPVWYAIIGTLAGHFLFPQSGITPWSGR